MKRYPTYAQYIPVDYFRALLHCFPYLWADKKYWDVNRGDLPFDFIAPFLDEYNGARRNVLRVVYLMLDESMSGWWPKTSKTDCLPHISYEVWQPVRVRRRVELADVHHVVLVLENGSCVCVCQRK